jgi:hypothetical protein
MEDLFGGVCGLLGFAIAILSLIGTWKVFEKAGHPGWMLFIPFLNILAWLRIAGRPWWWIFLLMLIPIIPAVIVSIDIAKSFGKDTAYGIGLAFLPFVFYPMLGFGDAEYQYEPDPIF